MRFERGAVCAEGNADHQWVTLQSVFNTSPCNASTVALIAVVLRKSKPKLQTDNTAQVSMDSMQFKGGASPCHGEAQRMSSTGSLAQ